MPGKLLVARWRAVTNVALQNLIVNLAMTKDGGLGFANAVRRICREDLVAASLECFAPMYWCCMKKNGLCSKVIGLVMGVVRKRGPTFLAGFIFAILCFVGINAAMEPASQPEFCAGQCHEMKAAYRSWELSAHGANKNGFRAECVNCHLPSKEDHFFAHVLTKAYEGGKDMFIHYVLRRDYDAEKARAKAHEHMPNERCMHCHDSLLTKPGSSAARKAHLAVLSRPQAEENRYVACHEGVGHQREEKLFSE